jgi:hypothetical protein
MLQLDSILLRVDALAEAERLTSAGGDIVHWTGVVPSSSGGEVTWASAIVRLPVDVAVRLRLVALGEGLCDDDGGARGHTPVARDTPRRSVTPYAGSQDHEHGDPDRGPATRQGRPTAPIPDSG